MPSVTYYCSCGYPIGIAGHWTGRTYELTLHEAHGTRTGEALLTCPQCSKRLAVADLSPLPPVKLTWPPAEAAAWLADEEAS